MQKFIIDLDTKIPLCNKYFYTKPGDHTRRVYLYRFQNRWYHTFSFIYRLHLLFLVKILYFWIKKQQYKPYWNEYRYLSHELFLPSWQ